MNYWIVIGSAVASLITTHILNKLLNKKEGGDPKELFLVMTFGVASSMIRGLCASMAEAKFIAREISKDGGAPKIYRCKLVK